MTETVSPDLETIRATLTRVGRAVLKAVSFGDASTSADLGSWTSLRHVQLLAALEREFDIEFTPEEAPALTSFESLLAAICERLEPLSGSAGD